MVDAVVVGAGHNGLVAANLLADFGWDVLVLESQPEPGGAVRSGELTEPGFTHDLFSAFYPLAAASPILQYFALEEFGLRWCRAPQVLANPTPDGRCALLSTDLDRTAASLDTYAPGDGDAWRDLYASWERISDPFLRALLAPFPPVFPAAQLLLRLGGPADALRFARRLLLPVRRLAEEEFAGAGGGLLLAGNALHTDLSPESATGALFGWLLCSLGQQHGFPVPEGGAGRLTDALVRRLESRQGRVECGIRVRKIDVWGGRAVGVVTDDGTAVAARRAVVADVLAPTLFFDLVGPEHLSPPFLEDLRRFQYDNATVKVDWALDGPIPWQSEGVAGAGTVHLADSMDHLTAYSAELVMRQIPRDPFLILGQMSTADPTRSPPGTETAWAYTHVPQSPCGDAAGELKGSWDHDETERFADRMQARIERFAPRFADRVIARHVFSPPALQEANESLVDGAINGGTAQVHQQAIFRPTPGLARPETPIRGLFLASSSAHPGGGVHGGPGSNAALAALSAAGRRKCMLAVGAAAAGAAALRRYARRSAGGEG